MSKADSTPAVDSAQMDPGSGGGYMVYAAGGLFTQHELATNVLIKEAVWRLSNGRFHLVLPQSKELVKLDAAFLRNADLLHVVEADIILARFDGLELDSGTVVEFTFAKSLGKPVVLLRSDYRLSSSQGIDEPYNLMAKSWPRTVEVHEECILGYMEQLAEERQALGDDGSFQATLKAEMNAVQKGVDELAGKIIAGLETVLAMKSPYPPAYQEVVYEAARHSPGSGFDQLLTEDKLGEIIQRLRKNGTL